MNGYDMLNIASLEDSSEDLCAEWLTKVGRPVGSRCGGMRAIRDGGCRNIKEERDGCGRTDHYEEVCRLE